MSRMIDLIRASAVPSNLMQSASKGSLSVPAPEMIEILVYLAVRNKIFGQQAQLTLAGWDEASSRAAAGNPGTPREVLDYLISPKNLRPVLLPALLANPSVSAESLFELAPSAGREVVEVMLKSERVKQSPTILHALLSNPNLTGIQGEMIRNLIEPAPAEPPAPEAVAPEVSASEPESSAQRPGASKKEAIPAPATETTPDGAVPEEENSRADDVFHSSPAGGAPETDEVLDEGVLAYLSAHAAEITAEAASLFQPIGGNYEEMLPGAEEPLAQPTATSTGAGAAVKKAPSKKTSLAPAEERGSALQKIAKLDIKGRIQLAMKGSKEERSLLIRDGTKIVALAVLESPKVSDGEVERFAGQKNVLEAVLRGIPMKRRFAKNYAIVRALVFNPRTPLDLALGLMKNILVGDLRNLSNNKEVSDTVRKLATKMFKQKMETSSKR
jgi:hypothetical protein